MTHNPSSEMHETRTNTAVLVLILIQSLMILAWIFNFLRYGFDVTDEGYYLNWIANPFLYDWTVTLFGYFYHPLYLLTNGSIWMMRWLNTAFILVLSFIACMILLERGGSKGSLLFRLSVALVYSTGCLTFLHFWLPTPNYNTLTFQGMLIAVIGLLKLDTNFKKINSFILIGLGVAIIFIAKPTSAVLFGILTISYYWLSGYKGKWWLAILSFLGTLFLTIQLIDGSMYLFIERYKVGIELFGKINPSYSASKIIRFDPFFFNDDGKYVFIIGLIYLFFLHRFAFRKCTSDKSFWWAFFVNLVCLILFGLSTFYFKLYKFQNLFVFFLVISFHLISKFHFIRVAPKSSKLLFTFLILMPFVYAFGTGNNFWIQASQVSFYWLLALLVFAFHFEERLGRNSVLILGLFFQMLTVIAVKDALKHPYRQPMDFTTYSSMLEDSPLRGLYLNKEVKDFFSKLRQDAREVGFKAGYFIIDLTGQSPGLIFVLQGQATGFPWISGGYKGSYEVAKLGLARFDCRTISESWLIIEPNGRRSISSDLLEHFGLSIEKDYKEALSWQTYAWMGGSAKGREQILLRPSNIDFQKMTGCYQN